MPSPEAPADPDWRWRPTFEHVVRLADGGDWSEDNVVLAHAYCNHTRHHHEASSWRKLRKNIRWMWKFKAKPIFWWWVYKSFWRALFLDSYPPGYVVNRRDRNRDFERSLVRD